MNINSFKVIIILISAVAMSSCHTDATHAHEDETTTSTDHAHETSPAIAADAHEHGEDEIIFTPEQAKAAGVIIEEVSESPFAEVITVTGSILPAQGGESTVSASITGIVTLTNNQLNEGSEVTSGQSLFQIATQAIGDGNPVAAAQAELKAAEKEWERAQELIKDKIISVREFEAAQLRYETAKSTAASLGNGKTKQSITASIRGYVQNLLVKNGDFVTAGQPLATITQNRNLQLRAEVPERYYASLNEIVSANFRLTYDADHTFELNQMNGRLLSSGRTVNKGDGFLPITFEFNNIGNIIPGSLAEIYLLGRTKEQVISVPLSALTEELGLYYVYLQSSDHGYEKREVKKGANNGKRVEILQGLHVGEKVVVKGAIAVKLAANSSIIPDAHAGHNH